MKRAATIRGRVRRQDGQALPMVALAMVVLLGFAGLVIDIGRVWVAQRQLQAAVDSAALVAGQDLPNATTAYSAGGRLQRRHRRQERDRRLRRHRRLADRDVRVRLARAQLHVGNAPDLPDRHE